MESIVLMHGSNHVIKKPDIRLGKENNDYGRGFYCTRELEMAKEWACKQNCDGFANIYDFDMAGLKTLDLLNGEYTILNWIALLLKNRTFSIDSQIGLDAREYLIENFLIDTRDYDIIIGYRADDSYFSFANSFVQNTLPLRRLNQALRLGKLGEQIVLVSEKAFRQIDFVRAEMVPKEIYYPRFIKRDEIARKTYREKLKPGKSYLEDIFVMDILREELRNDDPRIQRILSE